MIIQRKTNDSIGLRKNEYRKVFISYFVNTNSVLIPRNNFIVDGLIYKARTLTYMK